MRWGVVLGCALSGALSCKLDPPRSGHRDSAALASADSEVATPRDVRESRAWDDRYVIVLPDVSYPDGYRRTPTTSCEGLACGEMCLFGACDGDGGCVRIFDHAQDIAMDAGGIDAAGEPCPAAQPESGAPCSVEGQICLYPPLFCELLQVDASLDQNVAMCFCGGFRLQEHNCFIYDYERSRPPTAGPD
jgi:hypothetical protein